MIAIVCGRRGGHRQRTESQTNVRVGGDRWRRAVAGGGTESWRKRFADDDDDKCDVNRTGLKCTNKSQRRWRRVFVCALFTIQSLERARCASSVAVLRFSVFVAGSPVLPHALHVYATLMTMHRLPA